MRVFRLKTLLNYACFHSKLAYFSPATQKAMESPSYLKSEALRLIQQESGGQRSVSPHRGASPHPRGVGPHHHQHQPMQQPEFAEGRDQTLHQTVAEQQSGSFKRLTSALGGGGGRGFFMRFFKKFVCYTWD